MENIGSLWERGELEIRHEHLISDLLASELRIHLAANRLLAEPRVLLATFPGEQHRLGLELWAVDMVANKLSICILGADSPVDQIAKTAAAMDVHVVGIYASDASDADNTRQMIAQLVSQLPRRVRVWLGGNCAERLGSLPEDTERFDSYEEFDRVVNALVREHRKK
jgi:methylmalonyl-CoA mutase cobalamin-binding subunit